MQDNEQFLITLGAMLLLGVLVSEIGKRSFLPRVSLLLLVGMLVGGSGFDLIGSSFQQLFDLTADMALLMVGFLLGGRLTKTEIELYGKQVLLVSLAAALVAAALVTFGLYYLGAPLPLAIILGCIASATDPAAVLDVVLEHKKETPFTKKLLAVVAIDDAWALILFSLGLALSGTLSHGQSLPLMDLLMVSAWEIGGAMALGVALGLPAAVLTGRLNEGQPMLNEALGLVFICGGLAFYFEVSFIIAAMFMGATIANFAKHHEYPFHEIENIEWPFMVIFFILAGASLEFSSLSGIGLVGMAYIVLRSVGKMLGAYLGAAASKSDNGVKYWMGSALLPQAGVAIGMALVASNQFPQHGPLLLTLVISTTIIFEIIGPIATRLAIKKSAD